MLLLTGMKTGMSPLPSDESLELIVGSGKVGIEVMVEFFQGLLCGLGMSAEWALIVVLIDFRKEGHHHEMGLFQSCEAY